ncbi:hypothetical protein X566_01440 [Afipia sp. P52-10]|nr:hypothetical protein X566_01440 [Afipia sp. P52-10]
MAVTRTPHNGFMPPPVVERFDHERIKSVRLSGRIKRAVAEAMKDSGRSREEIAEQMSEFLGGEKITVTVLAQYTSTANDGHNIPAYRLLALFAVTGDARLLNELLAGSGFIAVHERYEALLRRESAKLHRERIDQEIEAADRAWRDGQP